MESQRYAMLRIASRLRTQAGACRELRLPHVVRSLESGVTSDVLVVQRKTCYLRRKCFQPKSFLHAARQYGDR